MGAILFCCQGTHDVLNRFIGDGSMFATSMGVNPYFRVPLNQMLENWSVLQRMRVPSKLIVWPDENHWILKGENSRYWYQEVYAWLKKYLGDATQTADQ